MKRLSDELKSSLTAAKLKALCILNDLSTSGNKSDLVGRLIKSGLSKKELGIEELVGETTTKSSASEELDALQPSLSLEDDDTITPEVEPAKESTAAPVVATVSDDDILDAEVLDAEFITLDEEVKAPKTQVVKQPTTKSAQSPATLLDMIKQPKIAAVFLVIMIIGAGTWYYFNNQLEPFTADNLRYGDDMSYIIEDGDFMASEGFLDLVLDQIETDDDICKLRLIFAGTGGVAITDGDSSQLVSQTSLDRMGAVSAKGGQGMDWLTVEAVSSYDLDSFTLQRHLRSSIPGSNACSDFPASVGGTAELTSTKWTEIRDRATIGTAVDWNLNIEDTYQGNLMTFGVGGLFGELETISPGLSMLVQPVELQELLANSYIDDGSSGSSQGWDWRVLGTETRGSTEMWKIVATNQDIQELCLGSASMTLLVEENNPWATEQTVNVVISGSDSNRQGCSTTSKLLGDYVLPDGELTMSHKFVKTSLSRGSKTLELGLSYDARPQANELSPSDDELTNWGPNGQHMPDDSVLRNHNLEAAIQCFDYFQTSASGAAAALDDNGYVWRAVDQQYDQSTQWNISWIASDDAAGWVTFNMTGTPTQENCQFDKKGTYDETVSYNRDLIPQVLNLSMIETSLLDADRFPSLSSNDGVFTTSGAYHQETRIGYLVVVPGSGINSILSNIGDATDGATTVDISRDWTDDGWNKQFNLVADATDGRVIGWNFVMNT